MLGLVPKLPSWVPRVPSKSFSVVRTNGEVESFPLFLQTCLFLTHSLHTIGTDIEQRTAEYTERFANPMVVAQRGFIDDIIEPNETRKRLCNDLKVLRTKKLDNIPRKHTNLPL